MLVLYDVHPRTLVEKYRCKNKETCNDCALTCPHGNRVPIERHKRLVPCGTEVDGEVKLCGQCRQEANLNL